MSCAKAGGPIVTIYTSYDVLLDKEVLSNGRDVIAHHSGANPPKPPFRGVNRHFQATSFRFLGDRL